MKDVQFGSAAVAGLPSWPACWIAVCGRHPSQWSLFSQHEMSESALDTLVITNKRACSLVDSPRARAMSRSPRLTIPNGLPDAQFARAACRGVRVEVVLPSALTSLNSAAYAALSSAKGAPMRYWSALSSANG